MAANMDELTGPIRAILGDFSPTKPGARAELARFAELFVLMANHIIQMETTVAEQFPKKLLAGSEVEPGGVDRPTIQKYLAMSDNDPGRAALRQDIEKHLTGLGYRVWAVVKSMESLPRRYAKTRSPGAIEEAPELSAGGGLFRADAKFRKCWEKYVELCGGRDAGTLVKTISDLHTTILVEILQARFGTIAPVTSDASTASAGQP
jgi:hypothetical protein